MERLSSECLSNRRGDRGLERPSTRAAQRRSSAVATESTKKAEGRKGQAHELPRATEAELLWDRVHELSSAGEANHWVAQPRERSSAERRRWRRPEWVEPKAPSEVNRAEAAELSSLADRTEPIGPSRENQVEGAERKRSR